MTLRVRIITVVAVALSLFAPVLLDAPRTAAPASAAQLSTTNLQTGFQIDGDRAVAGGTPSGAFDWDSFLTAPNASGDSAFTPTGPYTTAQGFSSTGIVDAVFGWDNGSLANSCAGNQDGTGSPGSQTPSTNPWAPGPQNVNDKGNLCSVGNAYEAITDNTGLRHAILYGYWTRLNGNGDVFVSETLEGAAAGRCDDVLLVYNYESQSGTSLVNFRRWVPSANDNCANPNGPGQWSTTVLGGQLPFQAAVGVRTEGPAGNGNQQQSTFGEFAVDLTLAGLFAVTECSTYAVSSVLTSTGNDFGAQVQDYLLAGADPLDISNCGVLTVTKASLPLGYAGSESFGYHVDRASGDVVLPFGDAAIGAPADAREINDSLVVGQTRTFDNVIADTNYRIEEITAGISPWQMQSIICTAQQSGGQPDLVYTLASNEPGAIIDAHFAVYPQLRTDCVITNQVSTVTVTKQTLPDGSVEQFAFDIGGHAAVLSDGDSATFLFEPGSVVDIVETVPAGWADSAQISCVGGGSTGPASARVTTVAGADVSCVFTNTQLGRIQISKEVFDENIAPDTAFAFAGTWLPGDGAFSIATPTGDGTNYSRDFADVAPGRYTVSEAPGQAGTIFAGPLLCTVGAVGDDPGTSVEFAGPEATFDLGPGETVSCFFVNVAPGRILAIKLSDPNDYDQDFDFTFRGAQSSDHDADFVLNPLPGTASQATSATWDSGALPAGAYTLTELGGVSGWTLAQITCIGGDGAPVGITDLDSGAATVELTGDEVITCLYTNRADRSSLSLSKSVDGVADDYAWSFGFSLTPADEVQPSAAQSLSGVGAAPASATWTGLLPGVTYTIAESPVAGWTSVIACSRTDGAGDVAAVADEDDVDGFQFTPIVGDSYSCAATNTAAPALVTLTKTVAAVAADSAWSFDFTLAPADGVLPGATQAISGAGPTSGAVAWSGLIPGVRYTLAEEPDSSWLPGALACDGIADLDPDASVVAFIAQPAQALSCAITNTPGLVSLDIAKTAVGGDATFQYLLTPISPVGLATVANLVTSGGSGAATFDSLVVNTTYALAETDQPGWEEGALACVLAHADGSTDPLDITGFTVEAGDHIACAITNEALPASITVVKNIAENTVADAVDGTFAFIGSWTSGAPALSPGGAFSITTVNRTGSVTFADVAPGDYTVAETAATGYDTTGLTCIAADDGTSTFAGADGLVGSMSLTPGGTVVCTFTNTEWGSIVVDKATQPADPDNPGQSFDFAWDAAGGSAPTAFSLTAAAAPYSSGPLAPGDYTVAETSVLPGWTLVGLVCTTGDDELDDELGLDADLQAGSVTLTLALQQTVLCTFTNAFSSAPPAAPALQIAKTVTSGPDEQAGGGYQVAYRIAVTNPDSAAEAASYDLDDRLRYGDGVVILSATATSVDGSALNSALNSAWDGAGDIRLATGVAIAPATTHTYVVTTVFRVATTVTADQADCVLAAGEAGTGALNEAVIGFVLDGEPATASAQACVPVPPGTTPPVTTPPGTMPPGTTPPGTTPPVAGPATGPVALPVTGAAVASWLLLGLVLLGAGALILVARGRIARGRHS